MKPHFLKPYLRRADLEWSLRNQSTGVTLASTVIAAVERRQRNKGLLGRDAMPADTALVLAPCSAIHTFFMRFSIDLLFVTRTGRVLSVRRALPPWRVAVRPGAFAVIELAAGASAGTEKGHELALIVS